MKRNQYLVQWYLTSRRARQKTNVSLYIYETDIHLTPLNACAYAYQQYLLYVRYCEKHLKAQDQLAPQILPYLSLYLYNFSETGDCLSGRRREQGSYTAGRLTTDTLL